MLDFWLGADSLISAYRGAYRFQTVPKFWDYLQAKAEEKVVVSSALVLKELEDGCTDEGPDELLVWARQRGDTLFLPPTDAVQEVNAQIAESVTKNPQYAIEEIHIFLSGADPWIIAHAKALGGKVVTFETSAPKSKRVKIPDVAEKFGVKCTSLWDMLSDLKAQL